MQCLMQHLHASFYLVTTILKKWHSSRSIIFRFRDEYRGYISTVATESILELERLILKAFSFITRNAGNRPSAFMHQQVNDRL